MLHADVTRLSSLALKHAAIAYLACPRRKNYVAIVPHINLNVVAALSGYINANSICMYVISYRYDIVLVYTL
jgi:hypothetical protein